MELLLGYEIASLLYTYIIKTLQKLESGLFKTKLLVNF